MRLNLTPDEFTDILMMFLLDCATDKDMNIRKTNPKFAAIVDKMSGLGVRSMLFMYFFNINANIRMKYRQIREVFAKKTSNQADFYVTQTKEYQEKMKEKQQIKKAIKTALKLINNGKDLNERNLNMLQEQTLKIMEKNGDI